MLRFYDFYGVWIFSFNNACTFLIIRNNEINRNVFDYVSIPKSIVFKGTIIYHLRMNYPHKFSTKLKHSVCLKRTSDPKIQNQIKLQQLFQERE